MPISASRFHLLGNNLKSPEGINDEIIEQFLEEITIGEDGKVVITLNSGFSLPLKRKVKNITHIKFYY